MEKGDQGDPMTCKDNYIALGLSKKDFMERRGPAIIPWDQWLQTFLQGIGPSYHPNTVTAHFYGNWSQLGAHINAVWSAIWGAGADPDGIWYTEHGTGDGGTPIPPSGGNPQAVREQHLRAALELIRDKPGPTNVKAIFPFQSHEPSDPAMVIETATLGAVYQDFQ